MRELREDLVSGEWVIYSTDRAKRPSDFSLQKIERKMSPEDACPFEDLEKSGNRPVIYQIPESGEWQVVVVPNKFPALIHEHEKECVVLKKEGPYGKMDGLGHHELVISRSHTNNFPKLKLEEAVLVLEAIKERFEEFHKDECLAYASAFHAWGPLAGASIFHPHYQILALPIIPPNLNRALRGSDNYFNKNKTCVYCDIIKAEKEFGSRVVYQNEHAIVLAPYVSRQPYELHILPQEHYSHFEKTSPEIIKGVADALQKALSSMEEKLGDPDYNFYLHNSPLRSQESKSFHWHIEIIPRLTTFGGFEWSTGIEINIADPDEVAKMLRI